MARFRIDDRRVVLFCFAVFLGLGSLAVYQLGFQRSGGPAQGAQMSQNKKRALLREGRAVVPTGAESSAQPRDSKCTYWQCIDSYKCGPNAKGVIGVYVYPLTEYCDANGTVVSPSLSREFERLLLAIVNSDFYIEDAKDACLFVPSIDILNEQRCKADYVADILQSLKYWAGGANHVLFNMLPRRDTELNTVLSVPHGKAVVAGGGFSHRTYRRTFDVAIPLFDPSWDDDRISTDDVQPPAKRQWFLVSAQPGMQKSHRLQLLNLTSRRSDILILAACDHSHPTSKHDFSFLCAEDRRYSHPGVLAEATFCIVLRTAWLGTLALGAALRAGCIPVVAMDAYVMPFSEVLDWKRAAVFLHEHDLLDSGHVVSVLEDVARATGTIDSMRRQARFLWERYFSTMEAIALTSLHILNDRIFPYRGRTYEQWNNDPSTERNAVHNPLGGVPLVPQRTQGFTAIVLTYDRVDSLFEVIRHLASVPSLSKVLVIWNNQKLSPPAMEQWPLIRNGSIPIVVKLSVSNRLSNRFYPYDEITTDCVLSIDDDITMLTIDELQFGYEVWREHSDRIVGYPPRVHIWDNVTGTWKYESEWVNDVSMVLTGAAFYHKYFNFLYTFRLPGNIKDWVDEHMNCEDIAMNYLATNVTGKAPIKVLQRMKFRSSVDNNMSNDILMHMVERNECMKKFTSDFGMMPLLSVEFRADPVLYSDSIVDDIKLFPDVGSI